MRRFTRVVEEYSVLETLLSPAQPQKPSDYTASIRKLREMHRPPKTVRARLHSALNPTPVVDDKLRALLTTRNLTSKDIDAWIQINVVANTPHYQVSSAVDAALQPMISTASQTALWAIMQFLAKYWQAGIMDERPLIRTARAQAESVLARALQVSHPTEYSAGTKGDLVELVGLPDLNRFERFAASFFQYMGVERGPTTDQLDPIDDLLFRLRARSGPLHESQELAQHLAQQGVHVSGQSSEELLSTLSRHFTAHRDSTSSPTQFYESLRTDLGVVQDLLASDITPGALRFLLVWLESSEELWPLLQIAEPNAREIYSECQLDLIQTMERFGLSDPVVMAQTTGLLARIQKHVPLQVETIDQFLLACAGAGNAAGVETALGMHRKKGPSVLPPQVLGTLLDSFPLTNFGSTTQQSRQLVENLRYEVPQHLQHKWIYAYFRAGGDIAAEWQSSVDHKHASEDADYLLALIATLPESSSAIFEVLDVALASEYRTNIIQQVRAGALVDGVVLNRYIAKYAMSHPELSDHEVDAMLPDLDNAHHVVRNQDAELIWPVDVVH